jgi:hypothetical protein
MTFDFAVGAGLTRGLTADALVAKRPSVALPVTLGTLGLPRGAARCGGRFLSDIDVREVLDQRLGEAIKPDE